MENNDNDVNLFEDNDGSMFALDCCWTRTEGAIPVGGCCRLLIIRCDVVGRRKANVPALQYIASSIMTISEVGERC